MKPYRLVLMVCFLLGSLGAGERIYKTVDAEGNPVFTDVPPKDPSEGEAVDLVPLNTIDLSPPAAPDDRDDIPANDEPITGDFYSRLAVASPANEEAIRDNTGNVLITAAVEPALVRGHRLLLVFDDEPTEIEADQSAFYITNVDRGSHTVAVRIVDRAGNVLKQSSPVTFHLQRVAVPPPRVSPRPG